MLAGLLPKCSVTKAREPRSPSSSPLQSAIRIVRRGLRSSALRMRTTSMATETPAPLSVAPVPLCQESMWPPSMTSSSFRSVPGISATVL